MNRGAKPNPVRDSAVPFPTRRGFRIEDAADYSGLSPFHIEECIRLGKLLSIGGPKSGVSRAHIVLREHLDAFLDKLAEQAQQRLGHRD